MILAFDTYYFDEKAKTVCICFEKWTDSEYTEVLSEITETVAAYESGAFYKRELPCILSLLGKIDLKKVELIIVDGFVVLDDTGKPGLGGYLYEHLERKIPVVGVAKTGYARNKNIRREIWRGKSKKPLFITALGIDPDIVSRQIRNMHGNYRIPALLKQLDMFTKIKENGS